MTAIVEEFATWLAEFLPNDYYRQYPRVPVGPRAAA